MTKKKVFISGRMSGLSEEEFNRRFRKAEFYLWCNGYTIVNPCTFTTMFDKVGYSYAEALVFDLNVISHCDAIYMLSNWGESKGAAGEKAFAEALGKEVLYEKE